MPAAIGAGAGHPAVHWVFTLNNYSDDDVIRLCDERALLGAGVRYMVVGKEVGESGTPHLQGCVSFKNKLRMAAVKRIISELAHFEVCRAIPASREYCKKDGDYWTIGEDTVSAGKRSDLDDFKDAVKGGMLSIEEIRENHSEIYARYPRFVFEYIAANAPPIELPQHPLKPWQQELNDILIHEADTRTVNFVVDVRGNSGKSWFAHYFASLHLRVQVMLPGKKADMAYALDQTIRVLFVDAPRSKQGEFIQYDFLEDVKNGYVYSPKYESRFKRMAKCHVVVLMNEHPDMSKLSADRYNIIVI
ncbi:MAG: putative viral replication protein [Sthenivirus nowtis]|uniref:Viral replication protein n=2 Tax=Cressdnaviricota TaxID=2732416 RepID=A0A345MY64_9VIRU|nr:MAG: replication initiation protein [Humpback whale blow-associated circo-like virus 2]AXH76314.1 MAG: putative viral replication protein [Cressdnaviricota sp.]